MCLQWLIMISSLNTRLILTPDTALVLPMGLLESLNQLNPVAQGAGLVQLALGFGKGKPTTTKGCDRINQRSKLTS